MMEKDIDEDFEFFKDAYSRKDFASAALLINVFLFAGYKNIKQGPAELKKEIALLLNELYMKDEGFFAKKNDMYKLIQEVGKALESGHTLSLTMLLN